MRAPVRRRVAAILAALGPLGWFGMNPLGPTEHGGRPDVSLTLTARSEGGRYTLNGVTPGPQIHVRPGQLLQVTLVNESVPEGTALHWHGIAGLTPDAVLGVGERHVYRFTAPDEGTYWYHSQGLFGALVVGRSAADVDEVLVVHTYDGRRTINGAPGLSSLTGPLPVWGSVARVRVINTDAGPIRIWVSGSLFRVVAVDGRPVYRPVDISDKSVLVAAGGRVDLSFTGAARVDVGGGAAAVWGTVPGAARPSSVLDLLSYGAPRALGFDPARASRHFEYRIGRRIGFLDGVPGLWWSVNGRFFPDGLTYVVQKGDIVRMTLSNTSGRAHSMHLHGHSAVVLSRNGVAATGSPWWFDSLEVGDGDTYEIAFVADNPGIWAAHCHDLLASLAYAFPSPPR
ncbi:multicopper oxidase family protein [Actinoplanes sp. NPDC049596]|uniref:multicopper oxidase family protein n=1 Tax=unclassified Actinoplanes TaxID=2626549 RepID=UPI00343909C7